MGSTSTTLLGRLRDLDDAAAWRDFTARYQPRLLAWCRAHGMQPADADDVAQDVLLRAARRLRSFDYDRAGNFSGWLRAAWRSAWLDFLHARGKPGARGSGDSEAQRLLAEAEADGLAASLRDELDREVLQEALERVRAQVSPRDWEVFRAVALEGQPAAAVASRQGLTVSNVGVIKHRVQEQVKAAAVELGGGP
jgi:RNA polymerase sigma-70 factor (ECF subfamily)